MDSTTGHFVVGVDFGTTFTSVAFAHTSNREDVKLVQSWPYGSSTGESADQVPTELNYTRLGSSRQFQWGWGVQTPSKSQHEPLKWFKLLLQSESGTPTGTVGGLSTAMRHVSASLNPGSKTADGLAATPASKTSIRLQQLNIRPAIVVEDFLRSVREAAKESMESSCDKKFVKSSKVRYIVTIPAIWSDAAKAAMVTACTAAGYGTHRIDFHLVSEPEAAAAHTLKVIQPHDLKENDTFIICDAGGGTVDLISYKIRTLKPLAIDEVVSGSGDLCGAVYLDQGFKEYIEKRLGSVLNKMSVKARAGMEKSWQEQVKFKFTSGRDMLYEVNVPGIPDNVALAIEENYHVVERDSVQKIFDPVVERVIKLVDQQVRAVETMNHKVAAILLVGGFGSSKYLFERLQAVKYGNNGKDIEVIQPINAKTAIARGALLRGLDGSYVTDKRARRHYGVEANGTLSKFPSGKRRAYVDNIDGYERVPGCLFWYVKKNDIFNFQTSYSTDFFRAVSLFSPNFVFEDDILAYDHDAAPDLNWSADGKNVYKVCTMVTDLSKVPRKSIPVVRGRDGLQYYRLDYTIRMTMEDDVLKFELIYRGKGYGKVEPKFE